jgi:ABC-type sugar transport system substrate-binding protein
MKRQLVLLALGAALVGGGLVAGHATADGSQCSVTSGGGSVVQVGYHLLNLTFTVRLNQGACAALRAPGAS